MPYRLSPLAEQDLDEIWSYVAEDASSDNRRPTHRRHHPPIRSAGRTAGDGPCTSGVRHWRAILRSRELRHLLSSRRRRRSDRPGSSWTPRSDRGLVGVKLRSQASPNRRRKSARSGWNGDDLCSAARAKSLRSASNRSRPFAVLAAWRGVRFPSAGTLVSIQASQCLCINSASSAWISGVRSGSLENVMGSAVSPRRARRS